MMVHSVRELGMRIRDQRLELGLSQAALAERIGVSRSWVVQVERGNRGAAVGLVLQALTALGLILDLRGVDVQARPRTAEESALWSPDLADILDRARGTRP